jgi:hypothetical protein
MAAKIDRGSLTWRIMERWISFTSWLLKKEIIILKISTTDMGYRPKKTDKKMRARGAPRRDR